MKPHSGQIKKGEVRNPNGRPKGLKQDKWQIIDKLKASGFDLFDALIKTAKCEVEPGFENVSQEKILERADWARGKLLERISPALKAIEISTDSEAPVLFNFNIPGMNNIASDTKIINAKNIHSQKQIIDYRNDDENE